MKWIWYGIGRRMCRLFCMALFRCRIYGRENIPSEGAFLMVCNHQSYLDPLLCGSHIKTHLSFMARDSLFRYFFSGALLRSLDVIPVARDKADIATMKRIIRKLTEGKPVCLFPEGTRTSDGKIATLKGGFGLIARRAAVPIVPAIIDGGFECWPRQRKLFRAGSQIKVCYGEIITAERVKAMKDRQLAQVMTDTLRKMQTKCREMSGKEAYDYGNDGEKSS